MADLLRLDIQFFNEAGGGADGTGEQAPAPLDYDDVRYAEYDRKSPLLNRGSEMEGSNEPYGVKLGDIFGDLLGEETPSEGEPHEPQSQVPAPFRVIKHGDQEIPFQTEEDLDRALLAGLEAESMRNQLGMLAPYAPAITAIQSDEELANIMLALMDARRKGEPLESVIANRGSQSEPEPEQGDDETFDEYEKRLDQWKADRQKKEMERNFNELVMKRERAEFDAKMAQVSAGVTAHTKADPHMRDVLTVVMDQSFPPVLRSMMDKDPQSFMVIYDAISMLQGRKGHFGVPFMINQNGQQTGGGNVNKSQTGRTVIKERQVPFAERGGVGSPAGSSAGLPDFRSMSDEDFEKIKARVKHSGM